MGHVLSIELDTELIDGRPTDFLVNVYTFAAAIFIIAGSFIYFWSRRNREIAEEALAGADHPRVRRGTDGALPDLLGIALFALIPMGLLTVDFKNKPEIERAQSPSPTAQPTLSR